MGSNRLPGLERPAFKAETIDDLRDLITQAELIVANLRGAGSRAQTLLYLMDTIQDLFSSLQVTGVDLRAEETRIESIERMLQSKDSILVREMRQLGGLAQAREVEKPAPGQWWWYLDIRVSERRQAQMRRWLLIGAGVVGAFLIVSLVYTYVFPPDPKRVAAMEETRLAEEAMAQGDVAAALAHYRQAVELTPDDPEVQIWAGVLAEMQGDEEAAAEAYARAEELIGDQASFLAARGMNWYRIGNLDEAMADGEAALALEPDLAEGYMLLANVYEARGDIRAAMEAFEKTAELADKANNSALIVLAKTRLGMLMQMAPMQQTYPTPTPTAAT